MQPEPEGRGVRPNVGFWRHIPWVFVAGAAVSFGLVIVISAYFDTYAASIMVLWGGVIAGPFTESRKHERERVVAGDPHPARRPTASVIEVVVAAAFVLFTGGASVLVSYIDVGGDHGVPTVPQGVAAGAALFISSGTVAGLLLWVKRKRRATSRTASDH